MKHPWLALAGRVLIASIGVFAQRGIGEAHGRAEMMELNYLASQGAIVNAGGRYRVEYAKMSDAIQPLAKELLDQEAIGNRARGSRSNPLVRRNGPVKTCNRH